MSDDPKCEAGCVAFYGGEIRHHEDCAYYPESRTKLYDDAIKELTALRAERDRYKNELFLAVDKLEIMGNFIEAQCTYDHDSLEICYACEVWGKIEELEKEALSASKQGDAGEGK